MYEHLELRRSCAGNREFGGRQWGTKVIDYFRSYSLTYNDPGVFQGDAARERMAETHHIKIRMNQRGIRKNVVDLVRAHGRPVGDKIRLDVAEAQALLQEAREIQRLALQVIDKGGVVVVEVDGVALTTYNSRSQRPGPARRRIKARARRPEGYA